MSSGRSRRGGMWMWTTFSRQYRSSRKAPPGTAACRSRLVAAMVRKSTAIGAVPPRRVTFFSSSTRSSSTCTLGVTSPISSRKTVPPSADSNLPLWRARAPVKAPASWPKSSLSRMPSGRAPQLTTTIGL